MCEPTPGLTHLILSEVIVLLFVLILILVVLIIILILVILVVILVLVLIIILVVFILIVAHKNTSLSYKAFAQKKEIYKWKNFFQKLKS